MGIGFRVIYSWYNELEKGFTMFKKTKNFLNTFCRRMEDRLAKEFEPELQQVMDNFNEAPLRCYYETRAYLESQIRMARRLRSVRLTKWFSKNLEEVEREWNELVERIYSKFNTQP